MYYITEDVDYVHQKKHRPSCVEGNIFLSFVTWCLVVIFVWPSFLNSWYAKAEVNAWPYVHQQQISFKKKWSKLPQAWLNQQGVDRGILLAV